MSDVDTSRITIAYWEDDYGIGWIVRLRWAEIHGREECVGFEVRSWCEDDWEAFSAGDNRAYALVGAEPRRAAWRILKRMPLPLLITTHRGELSGAALRRGDENARWFREHGDRETAQSMMRDAQRRAEAWGQASGGHPRTLSPETWRKVASAAADAEHDHAPKSRAVAIELGIKNPTKRDLARMRKRIQRAREKGYQTSTEQEGE